MEMDRGTGLLLELDPNTDPELECVKSPLYMSACV